MDFVQIVDADFAERYVRQKIDNALSAIDFDIAAESNDMRPLNYSYRSDDDITAPSTTIYEESSEDSEGEEKFVTEFIYVNSAAEDVKIAGDWNEWIPVQMMKLVREEEKAVFWYATVRVTAGKKQFKLIVDGEWILSDMHPSENGKNFRVVDKKDARKLPGEEVEESCQKKNCCVIM